MNVVARSLPPEARGRLIALGTDPMALRVFISYSHDDEGWKERVRRQLDALQQDYLLEIWDDREIQGGADWRQEIRRALESADLAILLISADFLASKFIKEQEVPLILAEKDRRNLQILPVLVRPCPWQHIDWLEETQMRPVDARPLSAMAEYEADEQLSALANEIAQWRSSSVPTPATRPGPTGVNPSRGLLSGEPKAQQARYILYVARERVATLYLQVSPEILESPGLDGSPLLSYREPGAVATDELARSRAVRQLFTVLEQLEQTARIGQLESLIETRGRLDCDWYEIRARFTAGPWDPTSPVVQLTAMVGDYRLSLPCSKSNLAGVNREGSVFVPSSVSHALLDGATGVPLTGLVRLAAIDRATRTLRGSALYLVLDPLNEDLEHIG